MHIYVFRCFCVYVCSQGQSCALSVLLRGSQCSVFGAQRSIIITISIVAKNNIWKQKTLELKQFHTQRLRLCSSDLMLNICSVIFEAIKLLLRVLLVLFIPEPSIAIALTCCFWYGCREKTRRQIRDHIRRRCRRRRRRTHTFNSMHLTRIRVKQ